VLSQCEWQFLGSVNGLRRRSASQGRERVHDGLREASVPEGP
jgi:hypothetical protein